MAAATEEEPQENSRRISDENSVFVQYVLKLDTKEDLMEYILNRLKNSGSSPSGQ